MIRKVLEALRNTFNEGRYADKVVEFHLRHARQFGSRDRRFFAEVVYEIVRWWRRIYEASGGDWTDELLSQEGRGFKQPFPDEEFEQILANWLSFKEFTFRKTLIPSADDQFGRHWNNPKLTRPQKESIPDWLDRKGERELSKNWEVWLRRLNEEASVYLRANELLVPSKDLCRELEQEGFEIEWVGGAALRLKTRGAVFKTKAFSEGRFEMQDLHSQKVAELLQPLPGARVIDACAGAGGKTLHLAALMKNRGQIIALDVHEAKLTELKRRARRSRVSIVETRPIESTKVIKRLHESGDFVLLDVPCSGSGVLRRNPDSKWKLSAKECDELLKIQADILDRYSRMVKPGGVLVYSTCSIFPSENQDQVRAFLNQRKDFQLSEEMILPPYPGDGFYAAKLLKQ